MSSAVAGLTSRPTGAAPGAGPVDGAVPVHGDGPVPVLAVAYGDGAPAPVLVGDPLGDGAALDSVAAGVPVALVALVDGAAPASGSGGLPPSDAVAADGGAPAHAVAADGGAPPGAAAAGPGVRLPAVLLPAEGDVLRGELRQARVPAAPLPGEGAGPAAAAALSAAASRLGERPTVSLVLAGAEAGGMPGGDGASAWSAVPVPVRRAVEHWARAVGHRRVLLAAPRSFCAGVERAVEIVERSLERFGAPVYVRRQIVHNSHVVRDLQQRGAVFVQELHEVPDGATVVLAAHGVSPTVRQQAGERDLTVVDATCPLVAKVHREARRFAGDGRHIVLVGHADHEEVEGTVGEVPGRVDVVADEAEVAALALAHDTPVAYLTQTTLAIDETATVVEALKARFTDVVGPAADDICYATQNRQDAVRSMAADCDLVLVVGSANSSNTVRLVEVARRQGCRAELVEDESELQLSWLAGARSVGVTAGASAPESLVGRVVDALGTLGPVSVSEHRTTEEHVRFSLPPQVR